MIIPSGHRVVILQEKLEDLDPLYKRAKQAGIEMPDHEDRQRERKGFDKGTVISVGPDAFKQFYLASNPQDYNFLRFEPWCKPGDLVAFARYSGKIVTDPDDGKDYMVMNDEDIVCVVKVNK